MRKISFLLITLCFFTFSNAQTKHKHFGAVILLNYEFKGGILLFNTPDSKVCKILKHNFKSDDYIYFDILNQNDSMFYVRANYSINGTIAKGWIKKNNAALGIYAKAYSGNLKLYLSASKSSKISAIVKEYTPGFYQVLDSKKGWLNVEIEVNGKQYKGWMEPGMQCADHYNTCN